jgi:prolipoprotein diacylglyceryltransferase
LEKQGRKRQAGLVIGYFLYRGILTRFLIEFIKQDQEAFEANMVLNMGQLLSIPFILVGVWLLWTSLRRPPVHYPETVEETSSAHSSDKKKAGQSVVKNKTGQKA